MSPPKSSDALDSSSTLNGPPTPSRNPSHDASSSATATYASFSPATLSAGPATNAAQRRSTVLVHQKSPLLLATPPQVTRALAYSHPFLLPLNKLAGLLSWSSGDAWESFLVLAVFWATVLYGDMVIRTAGPVVLVLVLIAGMYGRRFSPLSSSGRSEPGQSAGDGGAGSAQRQAAKLRKRNNSKSNPSPVDGDDNNAAKDKAAEAGAGQSAGSEATGTRHQKTLDEIVETLKELTARCNMLLEPLLELTDFLSTQRTPTSATTRPALTSLFVRIVICTPFWFALTLPPWRIITTRRVVLVLGTVALTWHSRVMRVARTLMWRSAMVRRSAALITGLEFVGRSKSAPAAVAAPSSVTVDPATGKTTVTTSSGQAPLRESELTKALRRGKLGPDAGVRFTFILYENQRRWVGLGWTNSLFSYERSPWTDEHNNAVPSKGKFELPEVEDGSRVRWRWVPGSKWRVDGVPDEAVSGTLGKEGAGWDYDGAGGRMGWVYYDNKWQNGRRGVDGWGRWTRRRKWYRDAELVEVEEEDDEARERQEGEEEEEEDAGTETPNSRPALPRRPSNAASLVASAIFGRSAPATRSATNLADDSDQGETDAKTGPHDEYDAASILSSSSRSTKWKSPSLRRRATDSSRGTAASASGSGSGGASGRPRRTSEVLGADDVSSLGTQIDLEIQGAGKEGGSWGVGDEVRMGLE